MNSDYQRLSYPMRRGAANTADVKILQRDLRRLGYLASGIDGNFGLRTEAAIKALQIDLMTNEGTSSSNDGAAPLSLRGLNRGRIGAADGVLSAAVADLISELLAEDAFPKLPAPTIPKLRINRRWHNCAACLPASRLHRS